MSTRATILVTFKNGDVKQYYHHCDGYPEWMGKLLASYCFISFSCKWQLGIDETFSKLLQMEGHFEEEIVGDVHSDIEYCWYVDLRGLSVTYSSVPNFFVLDSWEERGVYICDLLAKKQGQRKVTLNCEEEIND